MYVFSHTSRIVIEYSFTSVNVCDKFIVRGAFRVHFNVPFLVN